MGNLETTDNSTMVTATLASGNGTLVGTNSRMQVKNGIATFPNLEDDKAETLSLKFTDGNLAPAISNSITVAAGAAKVFVVTRKPGGVTAGVAFDLHGRGVSDALPSNPATSFNDPVTAALASGTPGTTLSGTLTVNASSGVAAFDNLFSNKSGSISLDATSDNNLTSPPTPSIPVSPGPSYQLVMFTEPSATATAGQAFGTQPVVYEEDQFGNVETTGTTPHR